MGTASRGNAAEAAVLAAFVQRGYPVLIPFGDGHPYDLVVELGAGLLKVQCKRAWPSGACMVFNSRSTDHGRGPRSYAGRADIFGVYFPPTDSVYLVPIDQVAKKGCLRLQPTRNNQTRRVRLAADFAIDRWTIEGLRNVAVSASAAGKLEAKLA